MGVPQSVLVTGATGAVGPRVVWALCSQGWRVRTLSRNGSQDGLLPLDVEVAHGDIADSSTVDSAMEGIDTVIHMGALLHVLNSAPGLREKYEEINVGGTANVVNSAIQSGVTRVVLFSTIAVYGNSYGEIVTEDTLPQPETFYAQTKLAAERIVLAAKRRDGQPLGTVLRLGAVYGARVKGNYRRLLRSLAHRRFVPVGDGRNRRTLIHDKDVANAALLAASCPQAAGKVYNTSDGQAYTLGKIIGAMCDLLGRNPPLFSLPVGPVRFAAGLLEDAARFIGSQSPIRRATIDKYTEDIAVDSQRIQSELGFRPQIDLATGWKEVIEEMRNNGEL